MEVDHKMFGTFGQSKASALARVGLVECCAGIWLPFVASEGLQGVHALHL